MGDTNVGGDGPTPAGASAARPWWRDAVLYQVYLRSFADGDGDGIGDLAGLLDHLEYLAWLGVGGLWLSPVGPSPNADWGYDVADYCAVHPDFGTLDDLDRVIARAGELGMRVLLDLVPNHTSDRHAWFEDSRSSRQSAKRDWYVWADPTADGQAPNNWVSAFGGPAWSLDAATGQYYLHNFLPEQPDLNWWNDEVRDAFDAILRFWWDRGAAGFRIDVCNMIVKDRALRDNPPATADDPFVMQMFGQRPTFNSNQPGVHDVLRRWRALSDTYTDPPVLLGETNVEDPGTLISFYGSGSDELHLAFNFPFIESPFEADALSAVVEQTEALLPAGAWPVWTGSNHDVSRLATRWAGGDEAKIRLALLVLLTLRGTVVLYQGDEIGLVDGPITEEHLLDPVGKRYWPHYAGRDPERTPMPWDDGPGAGFTSSTATPWLPFSEPALGAVATQRADDASVLHFVRDLMELRRASADLCAGSYRTLSTPAGTWAWQRGSATRIVCNFSGADAVCELPGPPGQVALGTVRARRGAPWSGGERLGPWEGVVVD